VAERKARYTDMVNKYYDLATSFYEYGAQTHIHRWAESGFGLALAAPRRGAGWGTGINVYNVVRAGCMPLQFLLSSDFVIPTRRCCRPGWGTSFHFAHRWANEAHGESLKRHEHYLALRLGLKVRCVAQGLLTGTHDARCSSMHVWCKGHVCGKE
jgi:hypothetical protein